MNKKIFIKMLLIFVYIGIVFGGVKFANWIATRKFWIDSFSDTNIDNPGVLLIVGGVFSYLFILGITVPLVIASVSNIFEKYKY